MKVFVTGATGFVGANAVRRVQAAGHDVVALVRKRSPVERLPEGVATVTGDVTNPAGFSTALEDRDAVVHLAALGGGDPADIQRVNVTGTARLVEACVDFGVDKFVFTSTIEAYPDRPKDPTTPYEVSKVEAEAALEKFEDSLDVSVLYPTYILGPRDYDLTRYHLFRRVQSNPVLLPPLYLQHRYNVVPIDVVARSLLFALEEGGRRFVVSGENLSGRQLYRNVAQVIDANCLVVPVPVSVTRSIVLPVISELHERGYAPVSGDQIEMGRDVGYLRDALERTAPVEQKRLEQSIADTYEWYESVGLG